MDAQTSSPSTDGTGCVSWGGASQWEKINESDPALSNFTVGDFVDDCRADVFYADGDA